MQSRRSFVTVCGTLATTSLIVGHRVMAEETPAEKRSQTNHCVFTKPLQSMEPADLAESLARIGFGGTECPIRQGGMIDPSDAAETLPVHIKTLGEHGLKITIATTDIIDPDDPMTEKMLGLFRQHGINHYRMAYHRYAKDEPLPTQIDRWRGMLTDLADINAQFGIQGLYQNHAGYRMYGGPLWDLYDGIKDIDPDHLGVAYDLRHATVEGGLSWPLQWQLIKDHVRAFYVKDFTWQNNQAVHTPLGQGATDVNFYKELDDKHKAMPISIHEEYLDHKNPKLVPKHLAAIERDYKTFQKMLE